MISSILVASFVAAATLVPQSLAKLYVSFLTLVYDHSGDKFGILTLTYPIQLTSPVASTTCQAGQPCTVSWNDDGNAPTLSQIGTS